MPAKLLTISVKQPWAALLVAGVKTVEVRSWPTRTRGRILIHAARSADPRPEGWTLITTPKLKELTALRGGVIGVADLTACVRYPTTETFSAAVESHRNDPSWFVPGGLFGFVFQNPTPIAYHACPGRPLFFAIDGFPGERPV